MKQNLLMLAGLIWAWAGGNVAFAGGSETNVAGIGIYDSRAVAYAHFWSAPCQKQLQTDVAAAKDAQAAGDTNKFQQLTAKLRAMQDASDRQVFSTAPVDDALVSKWDEKALKAHPNARLVREFIQPTEEQAKTLASLQKSKPLPLEKADELIRQGKL